MGTAVTCDSADLRRAVDRVGRAVSARSTLPVLGALLLEAAPGRLRLAATDLEISIKTEIEAEIPASSDGEVALAAPARLLSDLAAQLDPGPVRLDLDTDTSSLGLRSGGLATSLHCLEAAEFPPGPVPDADRSLDVPAAELAAALADVNMAASSDEARPVMTGVLVRHVEDGLVLTASDGYRLAERHLRLAGLPESGFQAVVPARALAEVSRVLRDSPGSVRVSLALAGNQVFFTADRFQLSSSLIEGAYPNYAQVIPAASSTTAVAPAAELSRRLRAVSVLARDAASAVRLQFGRDEIWVEASATEVGEASGRIEARVEGEPVRLAVNVRYLLDALGVIQGEVEIGLSGPLQPALIRRRGSRELLHLIMPVRAPA